MVVADLTLRILAPIGLNHLPSRVNLASSLIHDITEIVVSNVPLVSTVQKGKHLLLLLDRDFQFYCLEASGELVEGDLVVEVNVEEAECRTHAREPITNARPHRFQVSSESQFTWSALFLCSSCARLLVSAQDHEHVRAEGTSRMLVLLFRQVDKQIHQSMQCVHVDYALATALFQENVFASDKILAQGFELRLGQRHLKIVHREGRAIGLVKKQVLKFEQLAEINLGGLQEVHNLNPRLGEVALSQRLLQVENVGLRLRVVVVVHVRLLFFFEGLAELGRHFLAQTFRAQVVGGPNGGLEVGWELRLVVGVEVDV